MSTTTFFDLEKQDGEEQEKSTGDADGGQWDRTGTAGACRRDGQTGVLRTVAMT